MKFLRGLDNEFSGEDLNLHLVSDHHGTHKHPKAQIHFRVLLGVGETVLLVEFLG